MGGGGGLQAQKNQLHWIGPLIRMSTVIDLWLWARLFLRLVPLAVAYIFNEIDRVSLYNVKEYSSYDIS